MNGYESAKIYIKSLNNAITEIWYNSFINDENLFKKQKIYYALEHKYIYEYTKNKLDFLENVCGQFPTIISKLKKLGKKYEFLSFLSEIQILEILYKKFPKEEIEYEPITNNNKKADIRLNDYYIEILTIFNPDEDKGYELIDKIKKKLYKKYFNKSIYFNITEEFIDDDIDNFVEFIYKNYLENTVGSRIYYHSSIGKYIACFNILSNQSEIIIDGSLGIRENTSSVKIKYKIISKLKKMQLPYGCKNILIINCKGYFIDESKIMEAFYGQEGTLYIIEEKINSLQFKIDKNIRCDNGLIDYCINNNLIDSLKNISLFIIYSSNYNDRIYIPNDNNSINPILKSVIMNKEILKI
jgi:hypothetical protein